jgi:hypothetical protein
VVPTAVLKTACRESGRVQLLLLPRMENELAVARARIANAMGPTGLRFDSAVLRGGKHVRII